LIILNLFDNILRLININNFFFTILEQPFVDEYREYYPEDDKFYFNYTFGDASKRVYFRSANAGNPGKSAQTQSLSHT
jgi:hypothetical protein